MTDTKRNTSPGSDIIVKNPMTNVVAIMRSEEAAGLLREAVDGLEETNVDVIVSPIDNLEKNPAAMNGHDILLIDVAPSNEDETSELKRFIEQHHQTRPVIVTSAVESREGVQRIMRSGAVDILPQPIRQVDLVIAIDQAVHRFQRVPAASEHDGKIISILKGCGGAGATTLAVQTAGLMAQDKIKPCRVAVIDLDIQFGNVGLYLDLQKDSGLADLMDSPDRLDQALFSGVMSRHSSGLHVLRAPSELLPLDTITPDFIKALLKLARQTYDVVFLDLPQSWTEWTYSLLCESDLILLLTQLHVGSVRQAAHQIETLNKYDLGDAPLKLILNRYESGIFSGQSSEIRDAEKALGRKFDFRLPNDFELTKTAINRGVLLSKVKGRSELQKRLQKMGQALRHELTQARESQSGH